MDKQEIVKVAKEYNEHIKEHGQMSKDEKEAYFKDKVGYSVRTFQTRVKESGLGIKANKSTGLYNVPDNEPVQGQITIEERIKQPQSHQETKKVLEHTQEEKTAYKANTEVMTKTSLYLPKSMLKELKIYAAGKDKKVNDIILESIEQTLKRYS